jgi:hypothetical protein
MARRTLDAALIAIYLTSCAAAVPADDVAGVYEHEGPISATLEVRREAGRYLVRLEGGGPPGEEAATSADCVIQAQGELQGQLLRARFGAIETDSFSYGRIQAEQEGRMVQIAFAPGEAEVVAADTLGYCGWGAEFSGRYRMV